MAYAMSYEWEASEEAHYDPGSREGLYIRQSSQVIRQTRIECELRTRYQRHQGPGSAKLPSPGNYSHSGQGV